MRESPEASPLDFEPARDFYTFCTEEIRKRPLSALTLAGAVGFVAGGGLRGRAAGLAMFVGKLVAGQLASALLTNIIGGDGTEHF